MKVISHRGFWIHKDEKNTHTAFSRSFEMGLGTETDVRDNNGKLVISHDVPIGIEDSFENFLLLLNKYPNSNGLSIALNIKSDGLAFKIASLLKKDYSGIDLFAFDMSIPDMLSYIKLGIPVFTRMSEIELDPVLLTKVDGVWLDSFYTDWFSYKHIEKLQSISKRICIVSPELHGRPYVDMWMKLKEMNTSDLLLCTDKPVEALNFFN